MMNRKNNQYERDLVLRPCLKACEWLVRQGCILEYRRLDALDYTHISGSPDIEIRFIKEGTLWIIMIECKKPGGGHHRDSQKSYRDKYELAHNVVYSLVESKEEMLKLVEELTQFYQEKLDGINI